MNRLSFYLTRQYLIQGMALFSAVVFLVLITQTLRLFDLVTAKGQSVLTLIGQSVLTTPPLSRTMLHICIGIGIVRTLQALQSSHELHTIHATRRVSALWQSVLITAVISSLAVGLLAHWIEPYSHKAYSDWTEHVAADLVGRTLEPHRFREITPGFVVQIGGRLSDGTITDFFADDSRSAGTRRTYEARRATINSDEQGLFLALEDGRIQHQAIDRSLTEIAFSSYKLGLDGLSQETARRSAIDETTTLEFFRIAEKRPLGYYERSAIEGRLMEVPLVFAMCLLAASLTAFPHGRRKGPIVPVEITIVAIGLLDRIVNDQVKLFNINGLSGIVVLTLMALVILASYFLSPYLPRLSGRTKGRTA